ncbi:MAG: hypothetical protein VX895_04320 [Chloroflexota bacterium]|jgi:hypothetical protein|nr:MAG: hypothetical protein EGP13_01590 [SAR202 cluster bacterium]MED5208337.1 hypothetical protein [Chloroflexota bacterium]MEE3014427.1 hypothetical protein [Chloroflexota bacterium]GIS94740.1 MAG: hypothetical protein CM1200mP22_19770 [Dehalococcoidia bacterium]
MRGALKLRLRFLILKRPRLTVEGAMIRMPDNCPDLKVNIGRGGKTMVNKKPNDSVDDIAMELHSQAVRLWGKERAEELESYIRQTAFQLWEVWQEIPHRDLEPGFYQ